jgi:putative ATP-dependent endonuclease of OLD family
MPKIVSKKTWEENEFGEPLQMAPQHGVFLNDYTFEVDLFKENAATEFAEAINALTSNKKMQERFEEWKTNPDNLDPEQLVKDIESVGKGRFAQRLATIIDSGFSEICPQYIKDATDYLVEKIST